MEIFQVLSHLQLALDRLEDLILQARGPLIPEESAPLVVAQLDQARSVPIGQLALVAFAEALRIYEGVLLIVA